MATSAPSSQKVGFRKPAPRKAGGQIADDLRKQLDLQRRESKQREDQQNKQVEQLTKQIEQLTELLKQQRQDYEQQLAQEKEENNKRHAELMDMLKGQKRNTRSS